MVESQDKDPKKRGADRKRQSNFLLKRVLKATAFPSVFPGLPSHFKKDVPAERSTETSSSARRARVAERHEAVAQEFLAADQVTKK